MEEKIEVVYYKYSMGIYSLKQLMQLVEKNKLSKDMFHFITTYSYDGLKDIEQKKGSA